MPVGSQARPENVCPRVIGHHGGLYALLGLVVPLQQQRPPDLRDEVHLRFRLVSSGSHLGLYGSPSNRYIIKEVIKESLEIPDQ